MKHTRWIALLLAVCMVFAIVLNTATGVMATEQEHEHNWVLSSSNSRYHVLGCDSCGETKYEYHTDNSSDICTVCGEHYHAHRWECLWADEFMHCIVCSGCQEERTTTHSKDSAGICTLCGFTPHECIWEYTQGENYADSHDLNCTKCAAKSMENHIYGTDGKCTVCGNSRPHVHQWEWDGQKSNHVGHHFMVCSCGADTSESHYLFTWDGQRGDHHGHTELCGVCGFALVFKHWYDETFYDGQYCKTCGYPGYGIKVPETEPIEHTHSYTSTVVAPNCTDEGYTLHTCDCGDSYQDDFVYAPGHKFEKYEYDAASKTHFGKCVVCERYFSRSCTFDAGTVVSKPTMDKFGITKYTCTVCDGSYEAEVVYRVSGADRSRTAIAAAEELKKVLGVKKFDAIILASGEGFADALAGSYLAVKKNAPILLVQNKTIELNKNYILENLAEGGTVYILGGPVAVPAKMEDALKGLNVVRLQGVTRIETNLLILEEAGVNDEEILICTGWEFADSLSASATGLPILMLNPKKNVLTDGQRAFLQKHSDNSYTIIGGTAAISQKLEDDVEAIVGETYRVAGATREVTSVMVAKRYFDSPDYAVVAYSRNFPDGLCGGPLAHTMNAPLLLVDARKETYAADYMMSQGITKGFTLGGTAAVSEASVQKVFLGK